MSADFPWINLQTLGYILISVGVIWFYIIVMREGLGWFLACLFFPPAPFLFWIQHLDRVKGPTWTWILGIALILLGNISIPAVREGRYAGSWAGVTDQGEAIGFQVASDSPSSLFPFVFGERGISEAAYNISTVVQFDSSCPLGRVSLSSAQSLISKGHIFGDPGSTYNFRVLNMRTADATASISGEFTSPTTASGTINIVDFRTDLQDRLDHPCPFSMDIGWTATKVSA